MVPGAVDAEAIEIRKNHVTMVMFQNESDDDFQAVAGHIGLMTEKAKDKVVSNWAHWNEIKGV